MPPSALRQKPMHYSHHLLYNINNCPCKYEQEFFLKSDYLPVTSNLKTSECGSVSITPCYQFHFTIKLLQLIDENSRVISISTYSKVNRTYFCCCKLYITQTELACTGCGLWTEDYSYAYSMFTTSKVYMFLRANIIQFLHTCDHTKLNKNTYKQHKAI